MSEHDGHRSRIIEKLDTGTLLEHEVLEILLFNAQPRKNTNDLAHRLLATFGNMKNIFAATVEELCSVRGVGPSVASYLCTIGIFCRKYYQSSEDSPVFTHEAFLAFVKKEYAPLETEVLDLYLLGGDGGILNRRRFAEGDKFAVRIEPSAFATFINENKTAGVICVHNHPHGKPAPSQKDDDATKQCQLLCSFGNVVFCDHVIYSPEGLYSYYLSGKLKKISEKCSVYAFMQSAGREV